MRNFWIWFFGALSDTIGPGDFQFREFARSRTDQNSWRRFLKSPPEPLSVGDRVALTARCAASFNRSSRRKVDWTTRQGTVQAIGRGGITVHWDACRSVDRWPRQALRVLQDGA